MMGKLGISKRYGNIKVWKANTSWNITIQDMSDLGHAQSRILTRSPSFSISFINSLSDLTNHGFALHGNSSLNRPIWPLYSNTSQTPSREPALLSLHFCIKSKSISSVDAGQRERECPVLYYKPFPQDRAIIGHSLKSELQIFTKSY